MARKCPSVLCGWPILALQQSPFCQCVSPLPISPRYMETDSSQYIIHTQKSIYTAHHISSEEDKEKDAVLIYGRRDYEWINSGCPHGICLWTSPAGFSGSAAMPGRWRNPYLEITLFICCSAGLPAFHFSFYVTTYIPMGDCLLVGLCACRSQTHTGYV